MSSRYLVDPELLPAIDGLPNVEYSLASLPERRAWLAEIYAQIDGIAGRPGIERHEIFAPGLTGAPDVRLLVYTHQNASAPRPAYLYIHGGGFVLGSADMADSRCQATAADLGCVVVSVDYRLAPEAPFPANVEDCYAGLKWLHDNARVLGVDPTRLAIGGESAGGGLAAALALLARDRGEVPIVHQQLVYPMLDDRPAALPHPFAGEYGWTPELNHFGWSCLLGSEPGAPEAPYYAVPARAPDLAGLPPTFIGVGALDLLLEENLEYARRLTRAGVPVELHVYPGAFHGSDMVAQARITKKHLRDQSEALQAAFNR